MLTKPHVVSFRHLGLSYQVGGAELQVLDDITFDVPDRSFVSIIGPSGCGKSTLLKVAAGVISPSAGEVTRDGVAVKAQKGNKDQGFVFQKPLLLPWRTALQNILLPIEFSTGKKPLPEHVERASELLELTDLDGFADKFPHQLSGGMQQRVSIARALITEPAVLLMDEPFSALDEITREQLQDELLDLFTITSRSVMFVTHNVEEAVLLSDSVVIMSSRPGRVIEIYEVPLPANKPDRRRDDPMLVQAVSTVRRLLRGGQGS